MTDISNHDDTIDSRDVIDRIEQLQEERESLQDDLEQAADLDYPTHDAHKKALDDWDEANDAELKMLLALASEAEGYADDWKYGATLVRDSYFTSYVQELLEDIGVLPRDLPSYIEINWEGTARNIQADYTSVDFGGVTYWVR